MDMMIRNISSILVVTAACFQDAACQTMASGSLTIGADTPVVMAEPREAGRSFMRLPSLNYSIEIDARCPVGLMPRSISLSVADTRKSLVVADISTETATTTEFSIPASQIGPVAVDNFCITRTEDEELSQSTDISSDTRESLTITSVVSLQASLLCANDAGSHMTYASMPLDITLVCEAPRVTRETTSN
jgi:hypothetical protein